MAGKGKGGARPNLVYVFADQLRLQSLGYAGDERARTPNIDALRSESLDLPNAVSGHPVCAPYRASLLTGKYTTSTGMVINEIRLNPGHRCFAHVLGDSGYEAEYIGKWHMYANRLGDHYNPANSFIPPGPDRLGFDGFFAAYNFHHEYYGKKAYYHLDSPEKRYCRKYEPDEQTDLAIERLGVLSGKGKPFALFLSLGVPHDPWTKDNVPPECLDRFKDMDFPLPGNYLPENDPMADKWATLSPAERMDLPEWMRVYYAMVASLDDNVGRLVKAIHDLGLEDDTILVFTSDHGEMFGSHGRRAKNIFYEEAVRVPFLMRWKGRLAAGGRSEVCLNSVDIMPTLLSLMDLPIPEAVEGHDLSPALLGGEDREEGSLMMGTGPTAVFGDGNEWRAWRTKRHTYAVYKDGGAELLFDNQEDPLQLRNLAGLPEYREVADSLNAAMLVRMEAIGDRFEYNSYYRKNWISRRVIRKTAGMNQDLRLRWRFPEFNSYQFRYFFWNGLRRLKARLGR